MLSLSLSQMKTKQFTGVAFAGFCLFSVAWFFQQENIPTQDFPNAQLGIDIHHDSISEQQIPNNRRVIKKQPEASLQQMSIIDTDIANQQKLREMVVNDVNVENQQEIDLPENFNGDQNVEHRHQIPPTPPPLPLKKLIVNTENEKIANLPSKEPIAKAQVQRMPEVTQTQCAPVKNFSFLKLHRVGSGSFHNILVRFAMNHNAFVGLANCVNYQVFPLQVSTDLFLPDPQHPGFTGYNMFIDHVLFNKSASDAFLPKDVVYFTQIRHPFDEAYSVYEHFWAGRRHVPYDLFLTNPEQYETPVNILWPCGQTPNISVSRNVMSLELGYTDQSSKDIDKFHRYLQQLDHDLLHVSILEELPQSMILLRQKMCWEFKDLLQLRLHKSSSESLHMSDLLTKQKKAHKAWSPLDYELYSFFLRRHLEKVARQPPSFLEEVEEFVKVQERFSHFCSHICDAFAGVDPSDVMRIRSIFSTHIIFPKTKFYETFTTNYQDCAMLQLGELIVKKALKYHMNPGICNTNRDLAHILHLSCDTENHVIPGLISRDINDLLDRERCEMIAYII